MAKTIKGLIMEYFRNHPNQCIKAGIVGEWVSEQYFKTHGIYPKSVDTNINMLHHDGKLIHPKYGIYKYDPDFEREGEFNDFSEADKQAIFRRDGYKCMICGLGEQDGVKIDADHIKARSKGGSNTLENGQTLCRKHNTLKKDYSQTEAGKRFFIKIYELGKKTDDTEMIAFCKSVFDVYDKHNVDRHIKRPDKQQRAAYTSR